MKKAVLVVGMLTLFISCASQRKQATCHEIKYRLDHLDYNDNQREWIQAEYEECQKEQADLAHQDSVQYRSIYEQFQTDSTQQDSTLDSTNATTGDH